MVWDPGSEIRKSLFRIPDPGVKKAPDPGSVTLATPVLKSIAPLPFSLFIFISMRSVETYTGISIL